MAFSPLQVLTDAKTRGERIAMVSLYDAPTAEICCDAGVDCILVGDSMGNAMLGFDDFLSVTVEDVLRHTAAVARGVKQSRNPEVPVVADLPFGSYASPEQAAHNATSFIRAGAHGIKLEGAGPSALAAIRRLVEMGAPVVGHLGFKPQSSLQVASVVQGKTAEAASQLLREAREVEAAGCIALVLEAVTSEVAGQITRELSIPTIGIGAGAGCVGQVLVWHDIVGLSTPRKKPFRFVKRYADARALFSEAAQSFADEVHAAAFPTEEHGWNMPETELEEWRAREDGR